MLTSLAEKAHSEHCALIVVDIQNDFCHPNNPFAKHGQDLSSIEAAVQRLRTLIDAARAAGVLVIFTQAIHTELTESEVWREQWLRRRHGGEPICREGTWGADFYEVSPLAGEPVVKKRRYSAFHGTDLDLILKANGIKSVIMTGVGTGGCVESTARDAFMRDYYVVFTNDCTATYNAAVHQRTLAIMAELFGVVCTSDEILHVWSQARSSRRQHATI